MPKDASADQDLIRAIAELLNEQNLAEIEIERDDFRVRVTRSYANTGVQQVMIPAGSYPSAPLQAPGTPVANGPVTSDSEDLAANPGTLTSPMVGTAYLAPEPGKPLFATVGMRVTEGQTIIIIEAMKTMNQIPAHKSGTISRILIEDAQPVEYGQPIAVID
jgi:acetyl-CoA carboxylase biotin carboxyl carrier protein